jgi:hypothetical protein
MGVYQRAKQKNVPGSRRVVLHDRHAADGRHAEQTGVEALGGDGRSARRRQVAERRLRF